MHTSFDIQNRKKNQSFSSIFAQNSISSVRIRIISILAILRNNRPREFHPNPSQAYIELPGSLEAIFSKVSSTLQYLQNVFLGFKRVLAWLVVTFLDINQTSTVRILWNMGLNRATIFMDIFSSKFVYFLFSTIPLNSNFRNGLLLSGR